MAEELVDAVHILTGPYSGIILYYGHVKVVPEGDTHRLAFQYTLWDTAGTDKNILINDRQFTAHLGDVLASIILDEAEEGEYVSARKHNSQEPDL